MHMEQDGWIRVRGLPGERRVSGQQRGREGEREAVRMRGSEKQGEEGR